MENKVDISSQIAVLEEIVKGRSAEDIAREFKLSRTTVFRWIKEAKRRGALRLSLDVSQLVDSSERDDKTETDLMMLYAKLRSADVIKTPRLLFEQADTGRKLLHSILVKVALEHTLRILRGDDTVALGYGMPDAMDLLRDDYFKNVRVVDFTKSDIAGIKKPHLEIKPSVVVTELPQNGKEFKSQDIEIIQQAAVVVGMSGGVNRASSLDRILCSGMVTHLVTDIHTARELIDLRKT